MRFSVVVPDPIRDEITGWGLSLAAEDELYKRLETGLAYGHETTCIRLAAPSPTFVYEVDFADPALSGITHRCTFWLTYGEREDALYVMQCTHELQESWDSES